MPVDVNSRRIVAALALSLCAAVNAAQPDRLPRRTGASATADETYPGVTVLYDSVRDPAGHRLRLIVTHPDAAPSPGPVIFVVGWLSCDSVEAPPGTMDATQLVFQTIARMPGFTTVRLDKPGVGDSEGDCAATDFQTELSGYRAAFRRLRDYSFIDPGRIFLFGISNGGGFAPLVADGAPVRGYVVDGGWVRTWYEHMLEIERRRLELSGHPPSQINTLMRSVAQLYSAYLLDRQPPRKILERRPDLRPLWDGDPQRQYGRPIAFYQQLQDLNLLAAWSRVNVPVLALHGEFDWIMSRNEFETLVALVNRNAPGRATLVELPSTGHSFDHVGSAEDAFAGKTLPFDMRIAERIRAWFEEHR